MNLTFLENIDRPQFGKAAKELMNHHCIIKRDSRDGQEVLYRFAEIEFYLYDARTSNLDVDTYDRECAEVEWFFHKSGVDISFRTTSEGNELIRFGGILIRGIEVYRLNEQNRWYQTGVIGGPQLSMFEIFNHCMGMPEVERLPESFESQRPIRITSRIGIKDELPQRFVFDDVDWNMKTERIVEHKDRDGKWHVVKEKNSRVYNPQPLHDYGLSM